MNQREQSCPFCNTVVPIPPAVPVGGSISCPRCEERFKVLGNVPSEAASAPQAMTQEITRDAVPAPLAGKSRLSNRTLGFLVLGVMGIMATIGTIYALWTQEYRRENDRGLRQSKSRKRPPQPDLEDAMKVEPLAPLKMPALALLPSDMDFLVGAHVRAVLQEPEGRRLLERDVPGLQGNVLSRLKRLEELTGILVEEIDHVVAGLRVSDMGIVFAVKTKRNYIEDRVVDRLGARSHPEAPGKKIYRFRKELSPLHTEGLLNCIDESTLLLAWTGDLRTVQPRGEGKPKPDLASLLEERVQAGGPVWLAGALDDRQAQGLALVARGFLNSVPEADRKAWEGVRRAALWMTLDPTVTIHAVARAVDEKRRQELEKWLTAKKDMKLASDREWVTLQYRPGE